MTDKFNPETHRFGMAYKNQYGKIGYISDIGRHDCAFSVLGSSTYDITLHHAATFYRAPEHDLIPVSVADKLADELKDIASNYDHDKDAHKYNVRCRMCFSEDALIEYENFKGGK